MVDAQTPVDSVVELLQNNFQISFPAGQMFLRRCGCHLPSHGVAGFIGGMIYRIAAADFDLFPVLTIFGDIDIHISGQIAETGVDHGVDSEIPDRTGGLIDQTSIHIQILGEEFGVVQSRLAVFLPVIGMLLHDGPVFTGVIQMFPQERRIALAVFFDERLSSRDILVGLLLSQIGQIHIELTEGDVILDPAHIIRSEGIGGQIQFLQSDHIVVDQLIHRVILVESIECLGVICAGRLGVNPEQRHFAGKGINSVAVRLCVGADAHPMHRGIVMERLARRIGRRSFFAVQIQNRLAVLIVTDHCVIPFAGFHIGLQFGIAAAFHTQIDVHHAFLGDFNAAAAGLKVAAQALGAGAVCGQFERGFQRHGIRDLLGHAVGRGVVDPALGLKDLTAHFFGIDQLGSIGAPVEAVFGTIGGVVFKALGEVHIQEISPAHRHRGGGHRQRGETGPDRLALLSEGFNGIGLRDVFGVGVQALKLGGLFGRHMVGIQIEVGDKVFGADLFLGLRIQNLYGVALNIVVVMGRGEGHPAGAGGDIADFDFRAGVKFGSRTGSLAGIGVLEIFLGQRQRQNPAVAAGLGEVFAAVPVDGHILIGAVDCDQQAALRMPAVGGNAGFHRQILQRGDIHTGEVFLINAALIIHGIVGMAGKIDDLRIVFQNFLQLLGAGGAPMAAVSGLRKSLMVDHNDGHVGVFRHGGIQLFAEPVGGDGSILAVNRGIFTVEADEVIALDLDIAVQGIIAVGLHIEVVDIFYGHTVIIGLFILMVAGDAELDRRGGGIGEHTVPDGIELLIFGLIAGVGSVAADNHDIGLLLFIHGQNILQIFIGGCRLDVKMNIADDTDFQILKDGGIRVGFAGRHIVVGVGGNHRNRNLYRNVGDGHLTACSAQAHAALIQLNFPGLFIQSTGNFLLKGRRRNAALVAVGGGGRIAAEIGLICVAVKIHRHSHVLNGGGHMHLICGGSPVGDIPAVFGGAEVVGIAHLDAFEAAAGNSRRRADFQTAAAGRRTAGQRVIGSGHLCDAAGHIPLSVYQNAAEAQVVIHMRLAEIHIHHIVGEGIQLGGQQNHGVFVGYAVAGVEHMVHNLRSIHIGGVFFGFVSGHIRVGDHGPALGQSSVCAAGEVVFIQNKLCIRFVFHCHGNPDGMAGTVFRLQEENTGIFHGERFFADLNIGALRCPGQLLSVDSSTVNRHGNICKFDLLIGIDIEIRIFSGQIEIRSLCRGREHHVTGKHGDQECERAEHRYSLFEQAFHAIHYLSI